MALSDLAGERIASALVSLGVDIRPLKRGLAEATGEIEVTGSSWGKSLAGVGKALTGVVVAGIAVIGALTIEGIKAADKLDANLAKLGTTLGYSDKAIASVRASLLDMSTRVPQGVNDLATAFDTVASAGYGEADALRIVEAAAKAAVISQQNLGDVVPVVTTVMKSWGVQAKDVSRVTAEITKTVVAGRLDWGTYARIMGTVTPIARSVGLSMEDVNAAIVGVGRSGLPARRAVSGVMALVTQLATFPPSMQKALGVMGVTYDTSMLKTKGLMGVLEMFDKAAGKHHDVIVRDANGQINVAKSTAATTAANQGYLNSLRAMLGSGGLIAADALISNHFQLMKEGKSAIDATSASLDEMYRAQQEADLGVDFGILKNQIQDAAITFGTSFLPYVKTFVSWLVVVVPQILTALGKLGTTLQPAFSAVADAFGKVASLIVGHPEVVASILSIAGALAGLSVGFTLLGPAIRLATGPLSAIMALLGPIGLIGTLLLGAGSGLAAGAGAFGSQAQSVVLGLVNSIIAWVGKSIPPLVASLGRIASAIFTWVQAQVPGWLTVLGTWTVAVVNWILNDFLPAAVDAMGQWIDAISAFIGDGSQIRKVVGQLAAWAAAFGLWAIDAGEKLIVGLAAAILVNLPTIVSTLWTVASSILGGIVDGFLKHPEILANGLIALFGLQIVLGAISAAGELAAGVYAAAIAFSKALIGALTGTWAMAGAEGAVAAGTAGEVDGAVYGAAAGEAAGAGMIGGIVAKLATGAALVGGALGDMLVAAAANFALPALGVAIGAWIEDHLPRNQWGLPFGGNGGIGGGPPIAPTPTDPNAPGNIDANGHPIRSTDTPHMPPPEGALVWPKGPDGKPAMDKFTPGPSMSDLTALKEGSLLTVNALSAIKEWTARSAASLAELVRATAHQAAEKARGTGHAAHDFLAAFRSGNTKVTIADFPKELAYMATASAQQKSTATYLSGLRQDQAALKAAMVGATDAQKVKLSADLAKVQALIAAIPGALSDMTTRLGVYVKVLAGGKKAFAGGGWAGLGGPELSWIGERRPEYVLPMDGTPLPPFLQGKKVSGAPAGGLHIGTVNLMSDPDEISLLQTFDFMQPMGA